MLFTSILRQLKVIFECPKLLVFVFKQLVGIYDNRLQSSPVLAQGLKVSRQGIAIARQTNARLLTRPG